MKTNSLVYKTSKVYTENGQTFKIVVKIRLNDECKNGHCDFSMTCDGYRKGRNDRYYEDFGGCAHDEILKHFPEFKIFADLHLCRYNGQPMYAVDNGLYHIREDIVKGAKYLRIPIELAKVLPSGENEKNNFKAALFYYGVIDQWKAEADKAIKYLEELCAQEWENPYKPEEEKGFLSITEEELCKFETLVNTGYYSDECIKSRKMEEVKNKIKEEIDEVNTRFEESIKKGKKERDIKLYILSCGISIENVIYYEHNGRVVFNWLDYHKKIDKPTFEDFISNIDYSKLPEGVTFHFKE